MDNEVLTDRQQKYVQHLASGMASRAAAKAAGYSESFSRVAVHRLKKKPVVAAALEAVRDAARQEAVYGLVEAVSEVDRAVRFGYEKGNPMSVAKLLELKSKLFGLLIDRFQEVPIDLTGALAAARERAFGPPVDITPSTNEGSASAVLTAAQPAPATANGELQWKPKIPGD